MIGVTVPRPPTNQQGNGNHHHQASEPSAIRVIGVEQANKMQARDKHKSNKNAWRKFAVEIQTGSWKSRRRNGIAVRSQ